MATTTPRESVSPELSRRRFLKRVTALGAAVAAGATRRRGRAVPGGSRETRA
jgi:hypothetical protein